MASEQVTQLLAAIRDGQSGVTDELLPLVYDELRRLARARLKGERPGITLQATALVHEAYIRLIGAEARWDNRAHFFAAAAMAMRRILVDRARKSKSDRHGGQWSRVTLAGQKEERAFSATELLALDEALKRLESVDARMTRVVMLRYFAGLSVTETAQALDVSPRTVKREWAVARVMLKQWMTHA